MVSSTPRPHFTPGKDPVPILQEAVCAPGPIWTGGKSRRHRHWIPDRPAPSQSLYRLSYRAHPKLLYQVEINNDGQLPATSTSVNTPPLPLVPARGRDQFKCDGTRAETRFRLSVKRTSPFKSARGVSSVDYWQPRCAHQR